MACRRYKRAGWRRASLRALWPAPLMLLCLGLGACGRAGRTEASAPVAATEASVNIDAPAPPPPGTETKPVYRNDGDNDPLGDGDGDNSVDDDRDEQVDHKSDDNGLYHDGDDWYPLAFGKAATPAQERLIIPAAERYYATASADDGASACEQLVPSVAGSLVQAYSSHGPSYLHGVKTCAEVMDRMFAHFHNLLTGVYRVTNVRVGGGSSLVFLGSSTEPALRLVMVYSGNRWMVAVPLGNPVK